VVFFPGSDGTWASPGHVGLVTGDHLMIQAYAPGTPIGTYAFGTASALPGTQAGDVIGCTRPWAAR
jgi:cell wall-associated NlpC family hydrolase